MSCYDVSPYTCTYDSGGNGSLPGGGNPDYSSVTTWESASDNDLSGYSGPVILDCYDSQTHTLPATAIIAGATNTSATVYREIRSSSGCETPWAGKSGTGANFTYVAVVFNPQESYCRLTDLYANASGNSVATIYAITLNTNYTGIKVINCVAKATNSNIGGATAYSIGGIGALTNYLVYGCIALDSKTTGFFLSTWNVNDCIAVINCTAINNGDYGYYPNSANGKCYIWNCYGANNTSGDFREANWDSPSGWNASKDNTSDLGGTAGDNYKNGLDLITSGDIDSDGLATADDLYATGGAGDNYGRNPYNDLSGTIDFDDFLKNDQNGEAISRLDIRGTARPNGTTADSSWNVGASQAAASSTITLTVTDLTSATTIDEPILSEQSLLITLTVNDLSSAPTLDAISLLQKNSIIISDITSSTTADNVVLSQKHTLAVADATSSQTLDGITLSLSTTLQLVDLTSAQTIDEITLTQGHVLAVNDLASATTLEGITLEASAQLSPADLSSTTTIDAVVLSQKHTLAVNGLTSSPTLDAVALSQKDLLNVNELSSSTSLEGVILSQKHIVSINDLISATTSGQITLVQKHSIVVADLTSASTFDEPTMTVMTLEASAEDATSASSIDAIILLQKHTIVIADLASSTTLDTIGEFEEKAGITVQDMASAQTLDALTLAQKHLLSINDAVSPSILDGNLEGTESGSINVRGATSSTSADNIDLKQFHQLLVDGLTSSTTLDTTETKPIITREDVVSASTADNITLTQWHILDPQDAISQGLIGEFTDIELAQYGYLNIGIEFSAMKPEIRFKGMKPEVEFVGRLAEARMRSKRL